VDYREPYRTKPLTKMLSEWRTEGSRNYRRTACGTTLPEAYQMTTEKQSTQTLPNVESRDAEICKCNVQSGFPRAEARSYHGEYDHLL